jgi:hypothetical protein
MKAPKPQKNVKTLPFEEKDSKKGKKKLAPNTSKVNVKSTKFWNDRYETEGEDLEKFIH